MPVLPPTIVIIQKLRALSEHHCDFARLLPAARAVRERLDWDRISAQTADNDYAVAFLVLADRLGPARAQWLRSLATSLSFVRPEYPEIPSSLARFFNSGTVQSWYDPDFPPLRLTADLPRPAAALEIRAAFSLESPCLRRSWYIFSFLIDELGTISSCAWTDASCPECPALPRTNPRSLGGHRVRLALPATVLGQRGSEFVDELVRHVSAAAVVVTTAWSLTTWVSSAR